MIAADVQFLLPVGEACISKHNPIDLVGRF
jgi:hypothetical protein